MFKEDSIQSLCRHVGEQFTDANVVDQVVL